jgi:phospholipase/carboxylesterase
MTLKTSARSIDGWSLRQRIPPGTGPHPVFILLHGWTGDETSMWIFASHLPREAWLIAPRGIYSAPIGGFSWQSPTSRLWSWVDDFQPAIEALLGILTPEHFPGSDLGKVNLVGFSQGAAFAYSFALQQPYRTAAVAGLSGFMPGGAEALARNHPLEDKQVFIAHGSDDELVPVARARLAAEVLQQAGAQVTYCEDQVGHKLSANCFQGLQKFFKYQPC